MQDGDGGVDMAMDAAMYFVMSHYHIGPSELAKLSPSGFAKMLSWATATEQVKAEKLEEKMSEMPSGDGETHRISSTRMDRMPFSE